MKSDPIEAKTTVDDQEYTLGVNFTKCINGDDPDRIAFFAIFFRNMMRMMTFE